ncbi:CPBP family intramembrane glutamic endopeptidase [Dethiobacter alkaliphilus]|uniref:CPBP family intramembrane glutamic endopeptidase n=1 Tax=Dethiobacter alkaliphilus TaxID=427926 RepID=UPI0022268E4B|nr:type II CAAX endopeptidase family protein [Dethiobacter alkaliphilus]MCW3489788.1 CPBP family intramembrane metalloprotease [Dethiobacter alkaliphilus]
MRYLKVVGFIAFFMILYFVATMISSAVIGFSFAFLEAAEGGYPSFEEFDSFISQNMIYMITLGSIIALGLYRLYFLVRKVNIAEYWGMRKASGENLRMAVVTGLAIYGVLFGIVNFLDIERFFPDYVELMTQIMAEQSLVVLLLGIGIIVPIFEEILFRGIIFTRLREDFPLQMALVLQAVLFALFHGNLFQISYALPAGILLGYIYLWTGSLWVSIVIHMAWNSSSVIVSSFLEEFPMMLSVAVSVVSLLLLVFAVKYFYNNRIIAEKENAELTV